MNIRAFVLCAVWHVLPAVALAAMSAAAKDTAPTPNADASVISPVSAEHPDASADTQEASEKPANASAQTPNAAADSSASSDTAHALSADTQAPKETFVPITNARQAADVLSHFLNGLRSFRSDFVQTDVEGHVEKGVFYLAKPKKFRWDYLPPSPLSLILNGSALAIVDRELDEIRHAPADNSLVSALASPNIDLANDPVAKIKEYNMVNGNHFLTLAKKNAEQEGSLTLVFSHTPKGVALKGFVRTDPAGRNVQIQFVNAKINVDIPKKTFFLPEIRRPKRGN